MKKAISMLLSMTTLVTAVSCSNKDKAENTFSGEQFNCFTEVRMDDGLLIRDSAEYPIILDYDTMESAILCNVPNCSHTTSSCVALFLKDSTQLPITYNNCAYFFSNTFAFADGENGKRVLDMSTTIHKYDFNKMEMTKLGKIEGYNADCDGSGSYLIGSEFYFTTNNGDPEYDVAGNVVTSTNGGQAKLYSINLDTEEITDYGEVFDYEEYKAKYPSQSIHTYFCGKSNDKLFFRISIGLGSVFRREVFTFDLKTHKIEKYGDMLAECVGEGYLVYCKQGENSVERDVFDSETVNTIMLENLETGEIIEGPEMIHYNIMNIINGKVWYDTSCYDIETKKFALLPQLAEYDYARAVAVYDGNYIIFSGNDDGETYHKIPCEEIDSLFE